MVKRKKKKKKSFNKVLFFLLVGVIFILGYSQRKPLESFWKQFQKNPSSLVEKGSKMLGNITNEVKKIDFNIASEKQSSTDQMEVGIPVIQGNASEKILYRKSYVVSFNKEWNLPNWVAWTLDEEKLVERESRTNKFLPDPDLDERLAVTTDDYKGSGFDRGHMCPAADNRWHWKAMQECFYMTNMCPQQHKLNAGDWKELEEKCRYWAKKEGAIHIVCGPLITSKRVRRIGRIHKVRVPDAFFKVVLCLESNPPRALGFIYKNAASNLPMERYVCTVDEVERQTNIDFFADLPDSIEDRVEASANLKAWK